MKRPSAYCLTRLRLLPVQTGLRRMARNAREPITANVSSRSSCGEQFGQGRRQHPLIAVREEWKLTFTNLSRRAPSSPKRTFAVGPEDRLNQYPVTIDLAGRSASNRSHELPVARLQAIRMMTRPVSELDATLFIASANERKSYVCEI